MIAPYIEETLQAIHTALRSADLTASQVEKILLVGGATRTPMIRRRLLEVFGHEPRGEVDADLCVALGAAIEGAAIAGAEVSAVLVDVTPYTFGTSALGEFEGELYPYSYVPIIPRNTPIPVRKSEVFYTVADNQTQVDVRIYQGENADALQNIKIGEFRVEGLSKAPAGNEVVLDLALDRDGILHVAAREKKTGLERRISIDQAVTRYEAAELQQARERIGSLFGETGAETAPEGDAGRRCGDCRVARKGARQARRRRRRGPQGDDRPDGSDPRRPGGRRCGGAGSGAGSAGRPAVLSRNLTCDGRLPDLPREPEWGDDMSAMSRRSRQGAGGGAARTGVGDSRAARIGRGGHDQRRPLARARAPGACHAGGTGLACAGGCRGLSGGRGLVGDGRCGGATGCPVRGVWRPATPLGSGAKC